MTSHQDDPHAIEPPLGHLERTLITEYLRSHGHDPDRLDALSEAERHALMREASTYASARLTEIESRSHYVQEIHGMSADREPKGMPKGMA